MTHLFLSPHFDDAVLGCGGLIRRLAQAGEPVRIFTVMAGDMPPDLPRTPFIEEHLIRWGLGPDPVPGRRGEDARAAQTLGAALDFGLVPDALYRTDGQGTPLYFDLDTLFGTPDPRDPVLRLLADITRPLGAASTVYAPLGAGHHVDHVIVRDAVLEWMRSRLEVAVFFYEEYPYSADGVEVVEAARADLNRPVTPVVVTLDEAALAAKTAAVACHGSQISTFWDSVPAMAQAVRQYAAQVGEGAYAERLWKPVRLSR